MKRLLNKHFIFILILIFIATIGVASASEDNSTSINHEGADTPEISFVNEVNLDDNENFQEDSDSKEIMQISNDEKERYYKTYTSISGNDINYNIDLSKQQISLPSIEVKIKTYSDNAVTQGKVQFEVNGHTYTSSVTYIGHATLSGDNFFNDFGTYTIKAKYLGTSTYSESNEITLKYTVNGKTTISMNDITVNSGQSVTIKPTVTPTLTSKYNAGDITLKINGATYTINANKPSLTLKLNTGTYSCSAEYGTNPSYVKSSTTFKITVVEEPLIISQDYYVMKVGQKYNLNIYVLDQSGNPISGGGIYLNDEYAYVYNGYAQFTFNPQQISYEDYTVIYSPSVKHYKKVTVENAFPIAVISTTKLTIKPMKTTAGTTIKNVKYTITDGLNRKISPSGYFLIKGKKYTSLKKFKTPKKGGTFKYTVKFVPDSILYGNSVAKLKIVNKVKTKVKVKSVRGYENKKVKLTAIVKDKFGKKIKKGIVVFKFRGKKYKVKVKNGKAKKTIRIPKSNNRGIFYKYTKNKVTEVYDDEYYTGKVIFLGNKYSFKSSSKFKVTSMKKSKTKRYVPTYMSEETGEISHEKHKATKKTKKHKTTKKKTKTKKKTYGYYPKYHKKTPKLNVNLFKKKPAVNTNNLNLKDIIITVG